MKIKTILANTKKELTCKIITSILIQGLLLVIPVYFTSSINKATNLEYYPAYKLIIITLILSVMYYVWSYLNQVAWYKFYNKIYLFFTNRALDNKKTTLTLGEYTNILNNDIDIIGTFLGNMVTRFIQVLEFFVIYIYFFKVNVYIFLITIIISSIMILLIFYLGPKIEIQNHERKSALDKKTIGIQSVYDALNNKDKSANRSFLNSTKEYLKKNANFNLFVNAMIFTILGIIEISRYAIIIYSIYLVSKGYMEIGTVLLIYSYFAKIITNFEVLGTIHAEYQSFKVSLKRLSKI